MRALFEKPLGSRASPSAILSHMLLPSLPRRRLAIASLFVVGLFFACFRLAARCGESDGPYCGIGSLRRSDDAFLPTTPPPPPPPGADTDADADANRSAKPDAQAASRECASFPDTSRVVLVMKTGASEAYARIPTQILTNLRCLPEYFFFSDMQQLVAGHHIRDSLDTVLPKIKLGSKDFDIYHRQKACGADQASCNKGFDVGQEGWNLDKYKNIHMAEKTYALRPDRDWYLFVDADTYVFWPTLIKWLEKLDAGKKHYMGSIAYVGNFPFGHGGSGYLLSQAAMRDMFHGRAGVANRWDEYITHQCCGDFAFSYALKNETGIAVESAWPTINGEKPFTLPYAENGWCQPIVTMHHMDPEEVSNMWAFEQERAFSHPMRIRDLYHRFVQDKLVAVRNDWDNLSETANYLNASAFQYSDWELERARKSDLSALELMAHKSFDDCRRVCQSLEKCVQYHFRNGICSISHTIRHGKPVKPEKEEHKAQWQHRSGWMVKRIHDWVEAHDNCRGVQYPVEDSWLS